MSCDILYNFTLISFCFATTVYNVLDAKDVILLLLLVDQFVTASIIFNENLTLIKNIIFRYFTHVRYSHEAFQFN